MTLDMCNGSWLKVLIMIPSFNILQIKQVFYSDKKSILVSNLNFGILLKPLQFCRRTETFTSYPKIGLYASLTKNDSVKDLLS